VTQRFEDAAVDGDDGIDGCMAQWTERTRRVFQNDGGEPQ
jgi:hypothetical protein